VAEARTALASGGTADGVVERARELAQSLAGESLRSAINMSGVVLHTGLGRARLAEAAVEHVEKVARDHSNLEFDEFSGGRGDRQDHVRTLLQELSGAEDALVVNNCAAAVVLTLNALAKGKEVLLSRGQMVEIGGSFRLPDIVGESGCVLRELGTTNKTRLQDYENALSPQTAAVLRCHPSNFQIVGFHEEPSAKDLSAFCNAKGIALVDDVGSGCLIDTTQYGLPKERTLREALDDGADVVLASGDKLLGGPQAGIVIGTKESIAKIKRHPLARAFRIDKLTLAGLEATLRLYLEERHEEIPIWRYVSRPLSEVQQLAETIASASGGTIEEGTTEIGGGSLPGVAIPTYRVGLRQANPEDLAAQLRTQPTPVVGYIQDGTFWLDPRTAEKQEVELASSYLSRCR
jgi:L-seryl-tRNA(Ser) seleniumtransferase